MTKPAYDHSIRVRMPRDLVETMKVIAYEQDMTYGEFVRTLIRNEVARVAEQRSTELV